MLKVVSGYIARVAISLAVVGLLFVGLGLMGTSPSKIVGKKSLANPKVEAQAIEIPAALAKNQIEADVLVLTSRNTIAFRGEVTAEKVADTQLKLMAMSQNLDEDDVIYLVLDTPGGSVDAGNQLVDTVNSLPQRVKTVTVFAASMGFHFAQAMDERLILPHGTLMSHRARAGLQGEVPGEMIVRLNAMLRTLGRMDALAAARMGISIDEYRKRIADEYWLEGLDAVEAKAADRAVVVRCDDSLSGFTNEYMGELFGMQVFAVMSRCPIVNAVLGIKVAGKATPAQQAAMKTRFERYFKDRIGFVRSMNQ